MGSGEGEGPLGAAGSGTPAASRARPSGVAPRRALAVAALGTFMATLDSSIVNITLPTIARDLGAGIAATQWVQLAYALVVTSLLLAAGRLSDVLGRRAVYVAGLVGFAAASALCGAAPAVSALVAARAVQAVFAALLMANAPALVAGVYGPGERGRALAAIAVSVSLGLMLGNSLGGVLAHLFGWRSIFLVNLPVGLGAAWFGWRGLAAMPPAAGPAGARIDWAGAATSFAGIGALLLALSYGGAWGFRSPAVVALFAAATILVAGFLVRQARIASPLLDLSLFRDPTFRSANAASLLTFTATVSVSFLVPFYLVTVLGQTPAEAGLVFLTAPLALTVLSPLGGRLADRVGSRGPTVAGLATIIAGLLALARLDAAASVSDVVWRLFLVGAGQGLFQTPNNTALLSSAPRERLGTASGLQGVMRNLGFALGVAVAGTVVAARGASLTDSTLLEAFGPALHVGAGFAAVALALCLARRDRAPREPDLRPAVQSAGRAP